VALGRFFHLIHVVDDVRAADDFYDRVFGRQCFMTRQWGETEKRWATLGLIGDFMMETIEPSSDPADAGMPLSRFHARFGQHLHSLAWFFDEHERLDLYRLLRAQGIRVARPGGGFFAREEEVGATMFTHPKDTHGLLEFQALDERWRSYDPRAAPEWSDEFWRSEHPLGLDGPSHLTTVVADLDRAVSVYREALAGRVLHEETTDDARSAYLLVGLDTVVELAEPRRPDTELGRELAANGELPHAVTWRVRDLEAAERHLEKEGVGVRDRTDDTLTLDPVDAFGAVLRLTIRRVPADPRPAGQRPKV
jgi:catechol 2,3-dioxygenase-like lactoylglutathione lyase family enzyme/extradiol dioxygenase family protein